MAIVRFSAAVAAEMLLAVRDALDGGALAGTARLRIYTGPMPASPDTAITTQTLLGTLPFADPCAPAPGGRTLVFSPLSDEASADASGTAAWARLVDSDGVAVVDGDVTETDGGGLVEIDSVAVEVGGVIHMTSAQLEVPL